MEQAARSLESAWRLAGDDGKGQLVMLTLSQAELTGAYPGITVGRHSALCDRVIDEPTISRRHFRLSRSSEGTTIEDLSSLNGTLLDGRRLAAFQPEVLRDGQEIVAGRVRLRASRVAAED
jgi:pSer/pThr/pTyr-binding forkhead associated (FHA) protein